MCRLSSYCKVVGGHTCVNARRLCAQYPTPSNRGYAWRHAQCTHPPQRAHITSLFLYHYILHAFATTAQLVRLLINVHTSKYVHVYVYMLCILYENGFSRSLPMCQASRRTLGQWFTPQDHEVYVRALASVIENVPVSTVGHPDHAWAQSSRRTGPGGAGSTYYPYRRQVDSTRRWVKLRRLLCPWGSSCIAFRRRSCAAAPTYTVVGFFFFSLS